MHSYLFSGYLRAFGHTKQSLVASAIGNVLNLILNAIFLMVFKWGVKGVAIATVISRIVNLAILIIVSGTKIKAKQNPERLRLREIFVQIIKIGIPSALETVLYNVAMTLVTKFLNQMDPDGLNTTARSYTSQITNFRIA